MPRKSFLRYWAFAAVLAASAALTGCAQTEYYAVAYNPAAALRSENVDFSYVTESEASSSAPVASTAKTESVPEALARSPLPVVVAPATARLDVDAEDGGPARLAEWDMPGNVAAAYPDLNPAELAHYMVGQHVGYQEPIPVP